MRDVLLPKINVLVPASVDGFKVTCIFGARHLDRCSVTRSIFDGCFQAYEPTVIDHGLPLTTQPSLGDLSLESGLFPS